MKRLLGDLFRGPGNAYWDLGRFVAFGAGVCMLAGQVWNITLGLPIELGPTGLGGGLGAVMAGQAALIFAKDKAGADARLTQAVADNVADPPKGKAKS